MKLEGSCLCGAVSYSVQSRTPYPYNRCFCSVCRKTGGSGYAINIMGDSATLDIAGAEYISVYRSADNARGVYEKDGLGYSRRHFCKNCGSSLYLSNANYAQWVYLCASSIDSDLPTPPAHSHYMIDHKANWVPVVKTEGDDYFPEYPSFSIEDWHKSRRLFEDED